MASPTAFLKRLLVGRPFRSDRLQHTLLPKRIALPVFASDALSSVAYAPDEILLTLSVAGATAFAVSPLIALAVVVVMLTVVASYRQNVHAYPSGGGDYEVATVNLGGKYGLAVASALLVDYVLTVAVSVSSGVQNLGSAVPWVGTHAPETAVVVVLVLTAINLRGIREAGTAFAIPTYAFMVAIIGMVLWGLLRTFVLGEHVRAESADIKIKAESSIAGFAYVFLLVRAFSSGCAALTGVEAISNGVPAFKPPKSRNAATTLLLLGSVAITMLVGIITLARVTGLQFVECDKIKPGCTAHDLQIVSAPKGYVQETVTAQLARTVFNHFSPGFWFVIATTALILVLAANTAYNGFPVLGSILAQDRYLPRQLHTRGDRLAFSNGIMFLAIFAMVLIVAFQAETTRLIQLYIVGVFVSFTLSQTGMVRHWNRLLRVERDTSVRRRMIRSRAINVFGLCMTGFVLVLVLVTKFTKGAWISIAAMAVIYLLMLAIRRHYDHVARELEPSEDRAVLPSRNHAVVLVSKVHQPTLRAVAYAQATRPDTLTAVTVNVDEKDTRAIQAEWERRGMSVPLTVVDSPYREITNPIIDYVKTLRRDSPRDVVTVFIPEYVVGHWWEHLLHNQSALRIKTRLLFEPGVMVTSVPWQLSSSVGKDLEKLAQNLTRTPARDARGSVQNRQRPADDELAGSPVIGDRLSLTVGPVAHGGHCVARLDSGQVVFVRHALPGEQVVAVVTEERKGYLRADAVEVLAASPDRVEPPCPYAGPGRCGGCDFQHAAPAAQLVLKAAVVQELLERLGGVKDFPVRVEPLPGGLLGWRSRVQYAVDATGRAGLRVHRSHEVVPVDRCRIAHPAIQDAPVTGADWPGRPDGVEVVASSGGDLSVYTRHRRGTTLVSGPKLVREEAVGRAWTLPATAFWQVHPAAPDTLAAAVLDQLAPKPGERAWDLYGGAGLFAAALAGAVGPDGRVTVVESDPRGVTAARRNLADLRQVRVVPGDVATVLANPRWRSVDLVVLDPPRAGAGADVVRAVASRRPRAVSYVACDPASFARDVATFRELGWRLEALRVFDAFPMTQHVECVGRLVG